MTLRHGTPMVAIPGPSVMPERVLAAFRLPMPNIYEGELLDVADEVFLDMWRSSIPGFSMSSPPHDLTLFV